MAVCRRIVAASNDVSVLSNELRDVLCFEINGRLHGLNNLQTDLVNWRSASDRGCECRCPLTTVTSINDPTSALPTTTLYLQPMNAIDILFQSGTFNLSKVGKNFINPCCFGEDLAAWLRSKLTEENIKTSQPYQEDWGWELPVTYGIASYYLCMSGNADNAVAHDDEGEWHVMVEKRRSVWQRLTGKGKIAPDDAMARLIHKILSKEATIRNVHRE